MKRLPTLALAGACGLLLWELWRPLRRQARESKVTRDTRNLVIAGLGAATTLLLEAPLARPLSRIVAARRWGLLQRITMPRWLSLSASAIAMDYTLYLWHVLTHRVPLLWRFHAMHHLDLDMDASTAIRFHFGELACSVPWRLGQICVLGIDEEAFRLWQRLLLASILFHHSNARLPLRVERLLEWFIVTPRLHDVHHSTALGERNANWSSGLSLWDRLHGTWGGDRRSPTASMGLPGYQSPTQVGLRPSFTLPFRSSFAADASMVSLRRWTCGDG